MRKSFLVGFIAFSLVFSPLAAVFAAPCAPANLSMTSGRFTNDTTPTFTWTPADGATWYEFLLDNGNWQGIGNVSNYTLWPVSEGWHTFVLRAHDNARGISPTSSITFEIDVTGPTISAVSPLAAKTGVPVTFTVTAGSADVAAGVCMLHVDGNAVEMKRHFSSDARSTTYTKEYTFGSNVSSATVYAKCGDGDGNYATGPVRTIAVANEKKIVVFYDHFPPAGTPEVARGTVIKTVCDSYAPVNDSCHAVYYYGKDGKKHAFPTESVYKSWFSSYNDVVAVTKRKLASMPAGEPVTYRPGTVLVKFDSSTTVYAIADGQVLRPIMNEAAAKVIYGARWQRYVVTVPECDRDQYTIGKRIYSSADYSKAEAYRSAPTIDANWE